jgi:hypothetical protein
LQTAFRGGVDRFVAPAGESLEAVGAEHGHDRAVFMFAAMVGGLALSRAIRMLTTQVRPIFCEPLRNNSGAWSIADRRLNQRAQESVSNLDFAIEVFTLTRRSFNTLSAQRP